MKRRVKINCIVCDNIDLYSFNIKIYDFHDNLILNNNTSGKIKCNLYGNSIYKIIVYCIELSKTIIRNIYVSNDSCNNICLYFSIRDDKPITFRLYDQNYIGLPIERGQLNLWI